MNTVASSFGVDKAFRLIFGGVFGLVGLGLLVGATISYLSARDFTTHSMSTTGIVRTFNRSVSRSSKGGTSVTYAPVVEYTAADGQPYTFTSSLSSSPPAYQEGQAVPVLYDPALPTKAEINDFMSMYFVTLILGFMGTIFATIGGCVLFIGSRRSHPIPPGPTFPYEVR